MPQPPVCRGDVARARAGLEADEQVPSGPQDTDRLGEHPVEARRRRVDDGVPQQDPRELAVLTRQLVERADGEVESPGGRAGPSRPCRVRGRRRAPHAPRGEVARSSGRRRSRRRAPVQSSGRTTSRSTAGDEGVDHREVERRLGARVGEPLGVVGGDGVVGVSDVGVVDHPVIVPSSRGAHHSERRDRHATGSDGDGALRRRRRGGAARRRRRRRRPRSCPTSTSSAPRRWPGSSRRSGSSRAARRRHRGRARRRRRWPARPG